jgi:hypothetical protein
MKPAGILERILLRILARIFAEIYVAFGTFFQV